MTKIGKWESIETAPVDGRVVTVRESNGAWGEARVMGNRSPANGAKFRHVWIWEHRLGKAYPVEWLSE